MQTSPNFGDVVIEVIKSRLKAEQENHPKSQYNPSYFALLISEDKSEMIDFENDLNIAVVFVETNSKNVKLNVAPIKYGFVITKTTVEKIQRVSNKIFM